MSKIVSFRIGKGKTAKVPESEMDFTRKYLELEIRLPEQFTEEGFHEALLRAEQLIDSWLEAAEVSAAKIPQLDLARIGELVWTRYSDRARATKPDEAAWTFSDPSKHEEKDRQVVEALVKAIKTSSDGKVQVGNVEFSLSGAQAQFITRKPVKKGEKD